VAADLGPGEDHLGGGDGLAEASGGFGGDGLDVVVGDEEGDVELVVAEGLKLLVGNFKQKVKGGAYGVSGDVDALLGGVLDQLRALENRVTLNLVGSGDNASGVDDGLEVLDGVVGDTNGAGLGLGQLDHGLPGVDDGDVVLDLDVTVGESAGGVGGEVVVAGGEGDGPVDEVQVEVVELQLSKAIVESLLNDGGVVLGVPELGCDEDVLALEAGDVLVGTLDALGDLALVLVDGGQIKVAVANLEGLVDGLADLAGGGLPGAESQLAVVC
jgi:hypothetical protein